MINLKDYIWQNEYEQLLNRKARQKQLQKIKLGRAVFIEKSSIPVKDRYILEYTTDLTNLYPIGEFMKLIGVDKHYNKTLKKQGKTEFKIAKILAYNLKLVKLSDEFYEVANRYEVMFLVNRKRPKLADMESVFLYDNEIAFY